MKTFKHLMATFFLTLLWFGFMLALPFITMVLTVAAVGLIIYVLGRLLTMD